MKINDILKWTVWVGIFATAFVPFVVSGEFFFPFIFGKALVFRLIIGIVFFAWVILAFRDENFRPKRSLFFWSFVGLLLTMAVSTFLSENVAKSFWSNFERMEGYVTLIHLFMYFLVVSSSLKTIKSWGYLLNTTLIASAIMALFAFAQLLGWTKINQGGVRVDATLGNATYLAIYMLAHIFLATLALWKTEKFNLRIAYGVLILAQLITLYYTATRGAILGLFVGLVVFALSLLFLNKENQKYRKISLYVFGIIIVLTAGFFLFKNTNFVKESPVLGRFASISLDETTTKSRFMVWGMAMKGFKERPVFGWGQESFNYVFNKYYDPNMYGQEQWFDRTHNVIFDWLIAGGILGLLAYLSLFIFAFYFIFKTKNIISVEKALLVGLLSAYFFHNLFVFDNLVSYLIFISVIAYVHVVYTKDNKECLAGKKFSDNTLDIIVPVSSSVVAIVFLVYFNWGPFMSNVLLIKSMKAETPNANVIIGNFKKAIASHPIGVAEAREQLATFSLSVVGNSQTPQDVKKLFVEYAANELVDQTSLVPKDARYKFFAGIFFSRLGIYDLAEKYFKEALELSPKKQGIMFELGAVYFARDEKEKMLKQYEEAYNLAPFYSEAVIQYALALALTNDIKKSDEILTSLPREVYYTDDRVIKVYSSTKRYKEILPIWEKRIELNPADIQGYFSLVAVYLKMNDKGKAVKILENTKELFPEFKPQIEQYIKDIWAGKNLVQD